MGRHAPVTRLALAFAAGAAWPLVGAPVVLAPLAGLVLLWAPSRASARLSPSWRRWWVLAAAAGLVASRSADDGLRRCGPSVSETPTVLHGRFLAAPIAGSAPFVTAGGCGPLTVVVRGGTAGAGVPLELEGVWREGRRRGWFSADSVTVLESGGGGLRWAVVRWRDALVRRLERLYGEDAPLVAALTLARREALDPTLRESFSRVGIAHLLAISGFHVGVVAGVLLALFAGLGLTSRRAAIGAATGSWAYVGFIGFPDAACRAALILSVTALSRGMGRPSAKWAPLGAALLLLLAADPSGLASPGFQLSFAGAAGLVAWSGPFSSAIMRRTGRRCPRGLALSVAGGAAATLATLPVVAWHFERVSLVGIPATLLASPLVTLGLIGALGSLLIDFVASGLASFLANGVRSVLGALESLAAVGASPSWASAWVTRGTVVGGVAGVLVARLLARTPRVGRLARRTLTMAYVATGVLGWPLLVSLQGRGSLEVLMIDVGQGDAIALRSPGHRWMLVDTGPAPEQGDPGGHPVVRALKGRGVRRLEALVLTHPDLDHIGGALAVLESFEVGAVYDPGLPAGKGAFVEVLGAAARRGVPWRAARAGDHLELDALSVRVLYPSGPLDADAESNAASVVLHARLGDFDAVLTGDAYKDVERELAARFEGDVEVLKVGHHGSDTSTDPSFLAALRPELALVSVGRYNRYGHPAPEVLHRLEGSGALIHRTDREGTVSVLGRPDGSHSVMVGR